MVSLFLFTLRRGWVGVRNACGGIGIKDGMSGRVENTFLPSELEFRHQRCFLQKSLAVERVRERERESVRDERGVLSTTRARVLKRQAAAAAGWFIARRGTLGPET